MQYNEKKAQAHLARATQLLHESEEDLGFGLLDEYRANRKKRKSQEKKERK